MKVISLLLAAAGGAGVLYHNQLQSWINTPRQSAHGLARQHQAPEGVYYLRTAYSFPTAAGNVRWSPGQELRSASDTLATNGMIDLTDGENSAEISQLAVTNDMDEAAALRRMGIPSQNTTGREASRQAQTVQQASSNRLVAGQFHETTLDAPVTATNRPENIVSTSGAAVIYPAYNTVVVEQVTQGTRVVTVNRAPSTTTVVTPQRTTRPTSTPVPVRPTTPLAPVTRN